MSDLPDAVVERIAVEVGKATGLTLGTIAAINLPAVTVTVTMGGVTVAGIRVLAGYYPTVGDLVIVERILGRWVVQGEFSKNLTKPTTTDTQPPDPTPPPVPVTATVVVHASDVWRYDRTKWSGGSEDIFWSDTVGDPGQGRYIGDSYTVDHGTLAKIAIPTLPLGAVVNAAKVKLARQFDFAAALVSPVLYGHGLAGVPAASGIIENYLTGGYGPWAPGTLSEGQSATWDLPSAWVTAWLAGTLKGFGVWSNRAASRADFHPATFCELTITYTYTP